MTEKFMPIMFDHSKHKEFVAELRREVNQYFKNNGISKTGGIKYYIKVPLMFGLFFTPYILMMAGVISHPLLVILMYFIMGLGTAAIGLVIMHDANHQNASSKKWVNQLLGYSLNLLGGSSLMWKIQHNLLHHTFTNIHDYDDDISTISILRFSPHTEYRKIHRFQHVYAWFLYCLMTVGWISTNDFRRLKRYDKRGLLTKMKTNYRKAFTTVLISKVFYYGYILVLPIMLTDISWWSAIIGFALLHFTAGLILASVFQPAHVTDTSEFSKPEPKNSEESWMVHQLKTTRNFGIKSRLLTWSVGGLNHQIEHHLFPNISHVHYTKLSKIVKRVTSKYQLPYHESRTFFTALRDHYLFLKQLGAAA